MINKIVLWIFKVITSKKLQLVKNHLTDVYRTCAENDLVVKTKIVNVKKAKRKYQLLFIEDKNGTMRINLGRHWEGEGVLSLEL